MHHIRSGGVDRGHRRRAPGVAGEGLRHHRGRRPHVDASERERRSGRSDGGASTVVTVPPEPRPYVPVLFHAREGPHPDESGGLLSRVGRPLGALPGAGLERPAVVAALEHGSEIGPDREPDAAMRTTVLPHVHGPVVGAPDRKLLAEQRGMDDMARDRFPAPAHGKPSSLALEPGHRRRPGRLERRRFSRLIRIFEAGFQTTGTRLRPVCRSRSRGRSSGFDTCLVGPRAASPVPPPAQAGAGIAP